MAGDLDGTRAENFDADLRPDPHPDRHVGMAGLTAFDVKELHGRLRGYDDETLRRIPIVPFGTRLEQGSTYFDLLDPRRGEFTAKGSAVAGQDHYYVPKAEVDYVLWNRLIGVTDPERLDEAGGR